MISIKYIGIYCEHYFEKSSKNNLDDSNENNQDDSGDYSISEEQLG